MLPHACSHCQLHLTFILCEMHVIPNVLRLRLVLLYGRLSVLCTVAEEAPDT